MFRQFIILLFCFAVCPGLAFGADKPVAKKTKAPVKTEESGDEEKPPEYNTIVLQGLNKVTGHISKLEGPLGATLNFDNLEIIARRCWKSPPEERPENAALLDISELKPGEQPQRIFLGWMFSSSPGISGLEHPVYDITVLACEARTEPEKTDKPEDKKDDKKENKKDDKKKP